MTLLQLKNELEQMAHIAFKLPNGELIPPHFHLTEIGTVTRNFVDCGGTLRQEKKASLQLWTALDFDHRLEVKTMQEIIAMAERTFNILDLTIEVQYQGETTLETFGVDISDGTFQLVPLSTACLALDKCGIPEEKQKLELSGLSNSNGCQPGSGCC
ncbi:MAG: DUF6428 family protein [Bacteroidota bacterium]